MSKYRTDAVNEWASDSFKGYGRIKCAACGEPLRDHEITEVCPAMNVRAGQLTTPSNSQSGQERRWAAEKARA